MQTRGSRRGRRSNHEEIENDDKFEDRASSMASSTLRKPDPCSSPSIRSARSTQSTSSSKLRDEYISLYSSDSSEVESVHGTLGYDTENSSDEEKT
ncbi:hypothetical protein WMY93_008890 [Mugilogobius chulae]|uniref:Uncharacterized protein n=1 Tax=Mugilogobius chulae TaxID=88201 RepID=A0AAW0PIV9_9GOBI